jgi:hypothetical protein
MPQREIFYRQGIAFEGMIGTQNPRVIRGAREEWISKGKIPYGRAVVRDAPASNFLRLPNAAGQTPVGIAIFTEMYGETINSFVNDTVEPGYPDQVMLNILTWGDVVVWVEEAVTVDAPALFRHTANGAGRDKIGRFAMTAGTGLQAYPGARFITKTTKAGVAWVALNIP